MKKIAIQGVRGAFHEIAARNYHEEPIDVVPAITFSDLIVESQNNDGGMMAIENSIAGSLVRNYPLIRSSNLDVTGELFLRIKHNLMALPGQTIPELKEVYSHPMAIAQCRTFFKQYPHIRLVEAEDTALSAKNIFDLNQKGIGAIASTLAAELYELEILSAGIEDNKQNYTRFLSLERRDEDLDESTFEKVSICFELTHERGTLYKVLEQLANVGANLTKIQSMPIVGNKWNYMFYIDFVLENPKDFDTTILALKRKTNDLKILGRYKKGIHYED